MVRSIIRLSRVKYKNMLVPISELYVILLKLILSII